MENLELIPGIMVSKKLPTGAALMRRWFAGPANNNPEANHDTQIVKMSWVLKFDRAKEKYDELISGKKWFTPNARDEIIAMLWRKGLFTEKEEEFGTESWFNLPANQLEPDYITMVSIQSSPIEIQGRLDDMDAALANFDLHLVVGGKVRPVAYQSNQRSDAEHLKPYTAGKGETLASVAGKHQLTNGELLLANPGLCNPSGGKGSTDVSNMKLNIPMSGFGKTKTADGLVRLCSASMYEVEIARVGIYVRDSYDFNDKDGSLVSQPLGFWNIGKLTWDVLGNKGSSQYSVPVFNSTFRDWRAQSGRGEDFLVFSDVKKIELGSIDRFRLTSPEGVKAAVDRVAERKARRAKK
jgi:hypothetical protein